MKINRTTRRGGTYAGRGRGTEGGYSGSSRGEVPRSRARAGYQRENGNSRENGYPRENDSQRENSYRRETVYQRQSYQNGYPREQYSDGYERQPAKNSSGKKIPPRLIGIGVFLVVAVAGVFILIGASRGAEKNSYYADTITPGVKINGRDVSGQDVNKLSVQLKEECRKKIDEIAVTLAYGDKKWTIDGYALGETDNVDDVMGKVALLARVGTVEQRRAEAQKYKDEGYEAVVSITPDPEKLKIKLGEIATEVSHPGKDASVNFNWLIDVANPDAPTQEEINSMFTVTPETPGQLLDVDTTAQKILDAVNQNPKCTVELIVNPFVPKYTAENLKQCFHLLSVFSTHISSVSTNDRVTNIKTALSKVNGVTLWPGQEFSFNDTTGPRTAANGYKMAHVISGGTYVDDWGGGVCQASTTLYNAVLYAGLTITDSGPHTIPSDYVKEYIGFDAMVNYPSGDLKFKNEYAGPSKNAFAGPIFIKCLVTAKRNVYVMIFGAPLPDGEKIERLSDRLYKGPLPLSETKVDEKGEYAQYVIYDDETYEVNKPHAEIRVDSYRLWKDKNGAETNRELLRHDHYPEVPGLTVTGKEHRPEASPSPTPAGGT